MFARLKLFFFFHMFFGHPLKSKREYENHQKKIPDIYAYKSPKNKVHDKPARRWEGKGLQEKGAGEGGAVRVEFEET